MALLGTLAKSVVRIFGSRNERVVRALLPIVQKINSLEPSFQALRDEQLRAKTGEFRKRLAAGETLDDLLPEAFAAVREASRRQLKAGGAVPMRHFDVQLIGGITLHQGKVAEMVTGEGKTLVATLPAYLNALAGLGVHVVTVNDYLARRDANWMRPVYEALYLTVGAIQSAMNNEERKKEYGCDITYGTNNEFGFDYLRDHMKGQAQHQVQRRLNYAIIDEVDSILIDEARTPLIISGPAEDSTDKYYIAHRVAQRLQRGRDYDVKEKEHQVVLTEDGIERAEKLVGVDSFFTGQHMEWPHHIEQSLRAKEIYKRDVDYVVKENQIVIVDEFTGRLMDGRVWSEGLHQAVEAKEGLKIKEENQTLATITLQNYFRLYKKIAGMTGTAMTEASEFYSIYNLDVVAIPTNKPLIRVDHTDVIYRTPAEKWRQIVNEIVEYHKVGRPSLVGTISIENSEKLSEMLRRRGIKHEVLNAKHHEREAEIVAKAGQLGNVTIATNMAGRGTDIVLGTFTRQRLLEHWQEKGIAPASLRAELSEDRIAEELTRHWAEYYLPEEARAKCGDDLPRLQDAIHAHWKAIGMYPLPFRLVEAVKELGGLHVLGTERHEARRIDNQLRGRCGRQGDPGSSRFYLSLHDDLMRRFAPERVERILERLGMTEGQEIASPMVSRAIRRAQKKVEAWNFDIRKSLLEYDQVMNEQRKIVYEQRQKVLEGEDLRDIIFTMFDQHIAAAAREALDPRAGGEEDPSAFLDYLRTRYDIAVEPAAIAGLDREQIVARIADAFRRRYDAKVAEDGEDIRGVVERFVLLDRIDERWKDHLHAMDQLKAGIGMRAYAQIDPKVAYKREGYEMFDQMIAALREDVTSLVLRVRVKREDEERLGRTWNVTSAVHDDFGAQTREKQKEQAVAGQGPARVEPIRKTGPAIGRNDPCPCGSGKKYKKCHGKDQA